MIDEGKHRIGGPAMNKALEQFNKATADESAAIDAFNAAD